MIPAQRAPGFQEIALSGLSEAEVRKLAEAETGRACSTALAGALHRRTEGNPLYLREVLRLLEREHGPDEAGCLRYLESGGVPASLLHALGERVDRHSGPCRELLELSAVAGRDVELELLRLAAAKWPERRMRAAMEESVQGGLLQEVPERPGCYRFTHALIRDALIGGLSGARRSLLHVRIGEALESLPGSDTPAGAARLSNHYALARSPRLAARLVRFARIAGEASLAAGNYDDAALHLRRAARAAAEDCDPAERTGLHLGLGRALAGLGRVRAAGAELRRAFELARAMGRTDLCLAAATAVPLDLSFGLEEEAALTREAFIVAPLGSRDRALLAARDASLSFALDGDAVRAVRVLGEAAAAAREAGGEQLGLQVRLASALVDFRSLSICAERVEPILAAADRVADSRCAVLGHLLAVYLSWFYPERYVGEASIRRYLDGALRSAERLRDGNVLAKVLVCLARSHLFGGRWQEARDAAERARSLYPRLWNGPLPGILARLEYETGNTERGRAVLARYARAAGSGGVGAARGRIGLCRLCADVAHIVEESPAADPHRRFGEEALGSSRTPPQDRWLWLLGLGLLAAERKDRDEAAGRLEAILAMRREYPLTRRSNCRSVGLIARAADAFELAARSFERAMTHHRQTGNLVELAWSCYDYADLLACGDLDTERARAATLLESACALAMRIGLSPLLSRAARLRKGLASRGGSGRGDCLSGREASVLREIARGKSNQEVARALFIGQASVASCLRAIRAKTRAKSRVEMAMYAVRHGLAPREHR